MSPALAPAKFTFDLDLGRDEDRNAAIAESAVTTMVADARTAGFAEGFAAGEQSVSAKAAKQMSAAANSLADHVAQMAASIDDAPVSANAANFVTAMPMLALSAATTALVPPSVDI